MVCGARRRQLNYCYSNKEKSVGLTCISCRKSVSSRNIILTEIVFDERQKQYIAKVELLFYVRWRFQMARGICKVDELNWSSTVFD